jgi:UDP-N-acetylmuramate--alanine ligase
MRDLLKLNLMSAAGREGGAPGGARPADRAWRQRIQQVHFVGIGGAGMGGIAELLHTLGYSISGSDVKESAMTRRLRELGINVQIGHHAGHVSNRELVVYSTAIDQQNVELVEARQRKIPVVPRAQMLAELMRLKRSIAVAGTHGKTTTTSLVANLLAEGGLDPTFIIGGRLNSISAHARLGEGEYLVAEADESDASFLLLQPLIAVVTNIDADHMDTYEGDFGRLRQAFLEFLHRLPFFGHAVLCLDDPTIQELLPLVAKPVVTYGIESEADWRADDIRHQGTQTFFRALHHDSGHEIDIKLNLPGRHNVLNALAAVAVAREVGVSEEAVREGLANFQGIARRTQCFGVLATPAGPVTLVDDYAHHPKEIAATVQAVTASWPGKRLVVVFQPHRFTRTRDLFEDFAQVLCELDALLLLEVYPAGEDPIPGADARSLARAIRARGRVDPVFVEGPDALPSILPGVMKAGDVVLTLGAGDIGAVPMELCALWPARSVVSGGGARG